MANENQADYIGATTLIKIEWGGTTTHRYITGLGYINYDSANWYNVDDAQGQIMSISELIEKDNEVANRDITLIETATIFGHVDTGTWLNSRVTIIEGNCNPQTNVFTAFNTSYWRLSDIPNDGGLNEQITFTMTSENLGDILNKSDAFTYSSNSQAQLLGSGITDTGMRYISNQTSDINATASSPQVIPNFNPRYMGQR